MAKATNTGKGGGSKGAPTINKPGGSTTGSTGARGVTKGTKK